MNRHAWRQQVIETALDPDLPIVDAHHHLWSEPTHGAEAYDAEALFRDMEGSGHNIIGTIYVDAVCHYRTDGPLAFRVVGETEYAQNIADQARMRGGRLSGACAGIVPHADLSLGERVGPILDAHAAASPFLRGIRHCTNSVPELPPIAQRLPPEYGDTSPGIMGRPSFRQGVAELFNRGLAFDAWVLQPQLPEIIDLARAMPRGTIVVNHLGGPMGIGRFTDRQEAARAEWATAMRELAQCENVLVKLGGLHMRSAAMVSPDAERPRTSEEMADAQGWHILTAIDLFGPNRCMFESNFPVDMLYTSSTILWNGFKRITASFSACERRHLFADTAIRAYGLQIDIDR
jgi:L-fuconolactonase